VITQWDWATPKEYFHDEISVDRRNPSSNPNGLVYGVHEDASDYITVLDPTKNSFSQLKIPTNPGTPMAEPEEVLETVTVLGQRARRHFPRHSAQLDDGCQGPNLGLRLLRAPGKTRTTARRGRAWSPRWFYR